MKEQGTHDGHILVGEFKGTLLTHTSIIDREETTGSVEFYLQGEKTLSLGGGVVFITTLREGERIVSNPEGLRHKRQIFWISDGALEHEIMCKDRYKEVFEDHLPKAA